MHPSGHDAHPVLQENQTRQRISALHQAMRTPRKAARTLMSDSQKKYILGSTVELRIPSCICPWGTHFYSQTKGWENWEIPELSGTIIYIQTMRAFQLVIQWMMGGYPLPVDSEPPIEDWMTAIKIPADTSELRDLLVGLLKNP